MGAPEQLAGLGAVLGSRSRLAVLAALTSAPGPVNINELARRVGLDASPVRGHLEMLLKEGLVREVETTSGKERRFETSLQGIRVTLEGVNRPKAPAPVTPPPKSIVRLQKRLEALHREVARLEEKGRKLNAEIAAAWVKETERRSTKTERG